MASAATLTSCVQIPVIKPPPPKSPEGKPQLPATGRYTGQAPDLVDTASGVNQVYSVCLGCRSDCGLKARVENGVLAKIGGNPYHPSCVEADEIVLYSTDPQQVRGVYGRMCAKGQAGVEALYNPFRVRQPLKRVGPRGSGQWEAIEWEQALTEIAERLSASRDLSNDIDPAFPEFGKRVNQVLCMVGRMEEGQTHFWDRFWNKCYGTINFRLPHDSVCEKSRHEASTQIYGKNHLKPDINNAQYIIFFGTSPLEAGFPMITQARRLMNGLRANGGRFVVVDPRCSPSAAAADEWVPIRPRGDSALAMGMIRYILENRRYNETFLKTPNSTVAANRKGNDRRGQSIKTHCSASWLVVVEPGHPSFGRFLRGDEAGLGGTSLDFVAATPQAGPALVSSFTTASQADGLDLFWEGTVNSIAVKTSFKILWEQAQQLDYTQYADIAGVPQETILRLAQEFTSHGTRAVADCYRGVCQKSDGFHQSLAVWVLNVLIGNLDRIGGYAAGGGGFDLTTGAVNIGSVQGGPPTTGNFGFARNGRYDAATCPNLIHRDGFPPKRPWFVLGQTTGPAWQDVVPSIGAQYPYPIKVLITYWANSVFTSPGARPIEEAILRDPNKIPLFIAFDIDINETSALADYILPEASYLERWGAPGAPPAIVQKTLGWRQPVVGTYDRGTPQERDASAPFDLSAPNRYTPVLPKTRTIEDILIDLGKRLGLPGVGEGAFADGAPLHSAWDWYKKILNNIVANAQSAGFSVSAQDVVRRGGIFQDYAGAYDNGSGHLLWRLSGRTNVYSEDVGRTRNSNTVTTWDPTTLKPTNGEYFPGVPFVRREVRNIRGTPVVDANYPLWLITYKPVFQTQSRTIVCPSLQNFMPENFVEMHTSDALQRGLETGDLVKVTSASNPAGIVGRVRATETIRPGVVAIANSYGHWGMSSQPVTVSGAQRDYDPGRSLGMNSCLVMRLDSALGDVSLMEPVATSSSYYETSVEVVKVA
jgi:anaerobic selenocysteine-containing dehydrogenase